MNILIYAMIYLGAALMVFNIYSFISYARYVQNQKSWDKSNHILYVPIVLLIFFLVGYLFVGIFGKPDLMIGGILFFGSVFVFVMSRILKSVTAQLVKAQNTAAQLIAAEKTNQAKRNLLASVSHEMRTPMNVIIGIDKIALSDPEISDRTRGHLEKIGYSAGHMLGLIDNILEMNKLDNNELAIRNESFSLEESLKQIETIVNTMCDEKGLRYVSHFSPECNQIFVSDPIMLRQILLCILDNAIKYTDAPGQIDFTVRETTAENGVCSFDFIIKDTGIGMSEDFLPKLFTLFMQEDSSSTNRYGGSGVSLALVNEMVKKLDGSIAVSSKKNVGSIFTVSIPLRLSDGLDENENYDEVSLVDRRILVVDDIEENAEIVKDLLELEGVICETAENGLIAVQKIINSKPYSYDGILMDLRMPVMDGLEATRKIREQEREDVKDLPIIALTANAFKEDIDASLEAGMNAHLAKPTDTEALYRTLRKYIGIYDKKKGAAS